VDLVGVTSRTASEKYNYGLGWRRVASVERFLKSKLAGASFESKAMSLGESWAAARGQRDNTETAVDRGVWVMIVPKETPSPPPPPPPPPPPKPSLPSFVTEIKLFAIKLKSGTIEGVGVGPLSKLWANFLFVILDKEEGFEMDYWFNASGGSLGIGLDISSVRYLDGDWNWFHASRSMAVTDFEGIARWASFGYDTLGPSRSTFTFGQRGIWWPCPLVRISDFKTGPTMGTCGISWSDFVGPLERRGFWRSHR
jgi:hypothetical protein